MPDFPDNKVMPVSAFNPCCGPMTMPFGDPTTMSFGDPPVMPFGGMMPFGGFGGRPFFHFPFFFHHFHHHFHHHFFHGPGFGGTPFTGF